jgi:LPXTG-site transpeptidase (sortase) family protein
MTMKNGLIFGFRTFSNFLIILGSGIFVFTYGPILYSESWYFLHNQGSQPHEVVIEDSTPSQTAVTDEEISEGIELVSPIDESFSVIIPKIEVNAPVIEDVSMADYDEYMAALKDGVAHAQGTSLPGESGNMFLFAHSSLNFWELGPYATVFNLLNKLEKEDLVFVVKDGETYMYKVESMKVVAGWDTTPFYEEYDEPTLTLVTCYPPGTTVNRYVVTATYVGVQ